MAYNFPKSSVAERTTLLEQIDKIIEEAQEVREAFAHDEGDDRVLEETWDVIHASEGLLRKFPYSKVMESRNFVTRKNEERGYYMPLPPVE